MIIQGYLFSILYALVCLAVAFILYRLGVAKKITRKIVHILVGFEWVILYHFVGASIHFLVVCLFFLALLALSHRHSLLLMISSDSDNAPGTVYYALAMSVMAAITLFLPKMMLPFGIGVFCTSLGDGFAGVVGQSITAKWNRRLYGNKTAVGTIVNFALSLAVSLFFSHYFVLGLTIWHCLLIAILSAEFELFTGRGLDNVTVTLSTSFLAYSFMYEAHTADYIIPVLLTPLIIVFSWSKRALTRSGIVAALVLDVFISMSLGNFGFCILCAFFLGGVVVDKIKKQLKKLKQNDKTRIESRGDCRDHIQVISNGAVAALCATLYLVFDNRIFIIAFVASLAEALADTVASGIGVLSGRAFDPFRMKTCEPGISGGMSPLGTCFSLFGASLISILALAFGMITFIEALIVAIAGFLGAIFDSFLGSLLQVKYRCQVCGSITERREHCSADTIRHSGIPFINNDVVNLLGTLFAASLALVSYYI